MVDNNGCKNCDSTTSSAKKQRNNESKEAFIEHQALTAKLCRIKHKFLVLSGKGGVGKSTVAVNLAVSLAATDCRVGLLDIDIHGPSVPKMLRLEDASIQVEDQSMAPVEVGGLRVMSIGFLLRQRDDAVIWRGPLKMRAIKQFIKDVDWGPLDYLIVDSPPGTGDEPLSICQLIEDADGAVIVTTPQDVAISDVRKCITFCRQLKMPVLGVIENMSGFVCPHCGLRTDIFKSGGGERMASEMGVVFLGCIPMDTTVVESGDAGQPFVDHRADTPGARAFEQITEALRDRLQKKQGHAT